MVVLTHRLKHIARIAGPARERQIDEILRSEPWISRALLEGYDPGRVALALMRVCDRIDMESEAHARRLAAGMRLLGAHAGLSESALVALEHGALVHDVGKLSVGDEILQSSDSLSPSALDQIRMHCSIGHAVLFGVKGLEDAATLVLHHHEYWDGSGYSEGRRGLEIPLCARIFAIVDAYDAMVRSDRPYRVAVSHEAAHAEVLELSGIKYDPALVTCFCSIDAGAWRDTWERAGLPVRATLAA